MKLPFKFYYYHFDWVILFFGSFILRLIGIDYGLPYEHHPDDEAIFGFIDQSIEGGRILDPGVYSYGSLHYYLLTAISLFARMVIRTSYIREYEILFTRIFMALIMSLVVVVTYEIGRRIYKKRWNSFFAAAFIGVATVHVIFSRYTTVDALISFFLMLTVYLGVLYTSSRNTKTLFWMFAMAGLTVSLKISYALFLTYPVLVFMYVKRQFIPTRKSIITLIKCFLIAGVSFILGNIFEMFHLYSWIGRNYYFYQTYSSGNYFYFKMIKENYFDHLSSIFQLIFADFFSLTPFTVLIAFMVGLVFIYQMTRLFKTDKKVFFLLAAFPLCFLVFAASRKIFLIRTMIPIMPLLSLIFFYPLKLTGWRQKAYNGSIILVFLFIFFCTISVLLDIRNTQPEKDLMSLIEGNDRAFALPETMKYPSAEYLYYSSYDYKLDLSSHFAYFQDKVIFYNSRDNLEGIVRKSDYFIVLEQMLNDINYKESNASRTEPTFEMMDIPPEVNLLLLLQHNNYRLMKSLLTSEYEMITKYEPASLSLKKVIIYKKEKGKIDDKR